ncbi:unnamed protein product [Adineta steineri]|uniref:Uncharacterized protein n=1 Tax=Adineta steineri TaxID=433720 RepID=A0A818QYS8_9BILA|nr:unnamed protein product [Adineta steineri]CAF3641592.1 unnamed protein product [Adineta steineri]
MASIKKPNFGHVVYDSGTDAATGKKRAVIPGGGVSVAERARLFGEQVPHSSPAKTYNSANHLSQRPPLNNQSTKSNVIHQERNYQQPPPRTDIDRRPKQTTSSFNSQRVTNIQRPALDINDRPRREQIPPVNSRNYSQTTRSYNHTSHSPPQRRPVTTYDSFHHVNSQQRQPINKPKHAHFISGESYSSEDDDNTYSALYEKSKSSHKTTHQQPNYFRPIQDPLDVLFKDSPQEYIQYEMPTKPAYTAETNSLQPFDLSSLIERIQQDYADNARPYVSSVQFVQHNQSLANIGFLTPATNRKDYIQRPRNISDRQAPSSQQYDIINTNGFYPYEKRHPRQPYAENNYSSMKRTRHHKRYHNQASSPIHILETSGRTNSRHRPERSPTPPPPPPPKVPTPVASSSSEEEEEEEVVVRKPVILESSSEEESEEGSEEESAAAPALPPPIQAISKPAPTSIPTVAGRTPLLNSTARPPAPASESDESDSDESETASESETDDSDKKTKPKPKPTPVPVARSNVQRTTPLTPQVNARVTPQRGNTDNRSVTQVSEPSHSVHSFDLNDSGKSSFGGKIKSLTNKFRRNKS